MLSESVKLRKSELRKVKNKLLLIFDINGVGIVYSIRFILKLAKKAIRWCEEFEFILFSLPEI
jgi:hypothetical protein